MGRNHFYEEFGRAYPDCRRVRVRVNSDTNFDTNAVFVFNGITLQDEYRVGIL